MFCFYGFEETNYFIFSRQIRAKHRDGCVLLYVGAISRHNFAPNGRFYITIGLPEPGTAQQAHAIPVYCLYCQSSRGSKQPCSKCTPTHVVHVTKSQCWWPLEEFDPELEEHLRSRLSFCTPVETALHTRLIRSSELMFWDAWRGFKAVDVIWFYSEG